MTPEIGGIVQAGCPYQVIAILDTEAGPVAVGVQREGALRRALLLPRGGAWQVLPLPDDLPLLQAVQAVVHSSVGRRLRAWDPDYLPLSSAEDLR